MKKYRNILLVVFCLIVLIFCLLLWRTSDTESAKKVFVLTSPIPSLTPNPVNVLPTAPPKAKPSAKTKWERISEELALTSRTPIEFYGRVIDQHGAPVPDVKVTTGVKADTLFLENHRTQHSTTTNGDGRFQFTGLHGQDMGIFLVKEGYEYKSDLEIYEYSALTPPARRHNPDPANPVIFTMWKRQGIEPLVHVDLRRKNIPVDGTPVSFNLLTGAKLVEGNGDLVLRLTRRPEHIQRGQPFDWKVTLEVPSGGIVEQNDEYPNEAPAEGYMNHCVIEMPAASERWQEFVIRSYYVKIRGGKLYGRLTLEFATSAEPPPALVSLEAWTNPSSSRNLEYDPKKKVPVP